MGRQRWRVALSLNTRENCASLQEMAGGPHQQGLPLRLSFSGTECGLQPSGVLTTSFFPGCVGDGREGDPSFLPHPRSGGTRLSAHRSSPSRGHQNKEGLRADLGRGHKGDAQILSNQGRSTWESHLPEEAFQGRDRQCLQVSHGAGGCSEPSQGGPDARRGGLAPCYLPHFSCRSLGL